MSQENTNTNISPLGSKTIKTKDSKVRMMMKEINLSLIKNHRRKVRDRQSSINPTKKTSQSSFEDVNTNDT